MTDFQAGDVFFTSSRGLLGRLIRRFQRSRGEEQSVINHVGLVVLKSDAWSATEAAETLEALWTVRRARLRDWLPQHLQRGGAFYVFRHPKLKTIKVTSYAVDTYRPGMRYGWWKLLLHLAGWKSALKIRKRPICSLLVGDSYEQGSGYRFAGIPGLELQPDDAWDVCMEPKSGWQMIYSEGVTTEAGGVS